MTNYVTSLIRTWVPIIIGVLVAWLAAKTGIAVDEETQAGFIATVTGAAIGIYYAIIRWLEERYPAFGWLLGLAKAPAYPAEAAPVVEDG